MKQSLLASVLICVAAAHAAASPILRPPACQNEKFLAKRQSLLHAPAPTRPVYSQQVVCGVVLHVSKRPRHTRSGWHGYFLLSVQNGLPPIRIVSNLDAMDAPPWPWVRPGDSVTLQGRYYFDNSHRQGIDWTHHSSSYNSPYSGFVSVNGHTLQ